ncbi:MAG: hypothetical protein ABWX68_00340 [Arthrobacter sp.]|uniref:hypothetical protein n=1 Tax=Arthrobacter sp. TaxID=1667 RepID=UPI00347C42A6
MKLVRGAGLALCAPLSVSMLSARGPAAGGEAGGATKTPTLATFVPALSLWLPGGAGLMP